MRSSPEEDVGWTSCSDGATGPTTTIFPRSSAGGTLPFTSRENDTVSTVLDGPA